MEIPDADRTPEGDTDDIQRRTRASFGHNAIALAAGDTILAAQKHDAALWLYVNALIQSCVFLLPTSLIHEKPP
jgi:hypothetical protein